MYDFGIVIGRFQPFHNSHKELLEIALEHSEKVIVVLGSSNASQTVKNPWTASQRQDMIMSSFNDYDNDRLFFVHARDYLYNNTFWMTALQEQIESIFQSHATNVNSVALFGHEKDSSSFYLHHFPQWNFCEVGRLGDIDATFVRELYFHQDVIGYRRMVPKPVSDIMERFATTDQFKNLHEEHLHYRDYHQKWAGAPFKPTFVTVDAVVSCSGHVLVVRRKFNPGKNLYALPGGFLNPKELIVDGMLRELREETGLRISRTDLEGMIVGEKVFDHPERSLRGRTITHAFHIDLNKRFTKLPPVRGGDDAAKAHWMPLVEVFNNEDKFFDDHSHIIRYFTVKI